MHRATNRFWEGLENLPESVQIQQLQDKAERLQISLVELVLLGTEEGLSRPGEEFRQAVEYVWLKNAELYRRLA